MTPGEAPVGFVPPPYPYDRLNELRARADGFPGGAVDLSIGSPGDPPPPAVLEALARSGTERGYPPSIGTDAYREAVSVWFERRLGLVVDRADVAACVGTKELVAGLPHWLRLRTPDRDTVLYPAVSYPSYAMGAVLAGCRAVAVPVDDDWRIDLDGVDRADVDRALCLWSNTPGNPAGGLDDLVAVAEWGRRHGDRCSRTSATSSSRGRESQPSPVDRRVGPSWKRAPRAWWRCTPCRNDPTSPG